MKKRVLLDMSNAVYRVVVGLEDWSQGDLELMARFGEPEVCVGGEVKYLFGDETRSKVFGCDMVRLLHGFPYMRGFDSRDYDGGAEEAVAVGQAWKQKALEAVDEAVTELRAKAAPLPTEEVSEI